MRGHAAPDVAGPSDPRGTIDAIDEGPRGRSLAPVARPVRIAVVVLVAPMFYLLPYALRSAGMDELAALVLGVLLAVAVFAGACLVAFRTVPDTPNPPPAEPGDQRAP